MSTPQPNTSQAIEQPINDPQPEPVEPAEPSEPPATLATDQNGADMPPMLSSAAPPLPPAPSPMSVPSSADSSFVKVNVEDADEDKLPRAPTLPTTTQPDAGVEQNPTTSTLTTAVPNSAAPLRPKLPSMNQALKRDLNEVRSHQESDFTQPILTTGIDSITSTKEIGSLSPARDVITHDTGARFDGFVGIGTARFSPKLWGVEDLHDIKLTEFVGFRECWIFISVYGMLTIGKMGQYLSFTRATFTVILLPIAFMIGFGLLCWKAGKFKFSSQEMLELAGYASNVFSDGLIHPLQGYMLVGLTLTMWITAIMMLASPSGAYPSLGGLERSGNENNDWRAVFSIASGFWSAAALLFFCFFISAARHITKTATKRFEEATQLLIDATEQRKVMEKLIEDAREKTKTENIANAGVVFVVSCMSIAMMGWWFWGPNRSYNARAVLHPVYHVVGWIFGITLIWFCHTQFVYLSIGGYTKFRECSDIVAALGQPQSFQNAKQILRWWQLRYYFIRFWIPYELAYVLATVTAVIISNALGLIWLLQNVIRDGTVKYFTGFWTLQFIQLAILFCYPLFEGCNVFDYQQKHIPMLLAEKSRLFLSSVQPDRRKKSVDDKFEDRRVKKMVLILEMMTEHVEKLDPALKFHWFPLHFTPNIRNVIISYFTAGFSTVIGIILSSVPAPTASN